MRVESFTDRELQQMRFVIGKPDRLALYFEGDLESNRNYILNTTLAPVSYVKEQDLSDLASLVIRDGYQGASKKLGVSEAFLKDYLKEKVAGIEKISLDLSYLGKVSEEELIMLAERVPYMALLEALSGWSKTCIKRKVSLDRLRIDSNLSTARGRKAELDYKEIRGKDILKDCNEEGDARCPYDFVDRRYGNVNVRSAKAVNTKTKGFRWYFCLQCLDVVDNLALLCYEELGDILLQVRIVAKGMSEKSCVVSEGGTNGNPGFILWQRT